MKIKEIAILGGSGFVGQALAARLNNADYHLRILTRKKEHAKEIWMLPNTEWLEGDPYDAAVLHRLIEGCQAVINLVGILNERGDNGEGFHRAHVELTKRVISTCRDLGVTRYLHMSALGADAQEGPSFYLMSKGEAEQIALSAHSNAFAVTVFKPSVIFGPQDSFINRFAALLKLSPLVFPLACPTARFAPVYVGDVTHAFAQTLNHPDSYGQAYELCGPAQYSLKALVQYIARINHTRRMIIGLPNWGSRLQANMLEWLPGKPFSRDNYRSLQKDSICHDNGFARLNIEPRSLESIVPRYLGNESSRGHFDRYRKKARRSGTR